MRRVRCAIYTRKSSEDGLEQDFNSWMPREACEAYIASQRHEEVGTAPGSLAVSLVGISKGLHCSV